MSDACRKYGLKFGIYLSPWDRHEPSYGDSDRYNEFYLNQLEELLTNYGEIFAVWLDGACGEGPNGKRQVYDWDAYYELVRRLQPNAVISVCGPDVRWCGNEAGQTALRMEALFLLLFGMQSVCRKNRRRSMMGSLVGNQFAGWTLAVGKPFVV